jgi:tetratricopeptide (TPR) repeat protein
LKLKLKIGPVTARARNSEAYDLYLQGLFLSDKSTEGALRKSLDSSTALSTRIRDLHGPGRALQSRGCGWRMLTSNPSKRIPRCARLALNAINIDDGEAEAHVYLAETKRILDWDLRGAEAEYLRAFEIDPNATTSNYFIAAFYAAVGEWDKALTHCAGRRKLILLRCG